MAVTAVVDSPGLRIEYLELDKIARFDRNPKKHDVGALVTSIKRYGFRDAPIFDGTLKALVAGHGRLKALEAIRGEGVAAPEGIRATESGQWLVPVQMGVDSKSAAEAKAFLIDHNTLTLSGGDLGVDAMLRLYDQDGLEELLKESGPTVSFDGEDIDELINGKKEVVEDDPSALLEESKELEKKWGTKLGQLWILGEHRVLCGDSTKAEDVERVMGGERADLWLTDPPYNVALGMNETPEQAKARNRRTDGKVVSNDSMSDEDFRSFLRASFALAFGAMKPGASFYVWHADSEGFNFRGAIRDCGEKVRQCLVWAKDALVMGRQDYHWQHEPCLYGWKDGAAHGWYSDRKQTTLLHFDRPSRSGEHPTMKPVGLFGYLAGNSTAPQGLVYDPFLGSGTTLIAADQLKRKCYGLEISPQYVAVILERWSKLTGGEPKLDG